MVEGLGGLDTLIKRDPNLGGVFVNTYPVEMVDARDISNAVLFLASDAAESAGAATCSRRSPSAPARS
ncbi:hypothetical protein RB614_35410 [Phytohabitans sp. ZYX-F-186]|uniref:Uncharacterized protein n=1 Tax=Phytohabitans maris TaxID=3071409 RepID=A0ABU0ZRY4_9ACTN|nr:hypothetical protein [Phytohabitans sp. ZYX-F-186]MDQ7909798.1 hypothetical protein [Phytohabitans sp. ZYX-F-186]